MDFAIAPGLLAREQEHAERGLPRGPQRNQKTAGRQPFAPARGEGAAEAAGIDRPRVRVVAVIQFCKRRVEPQHERRVALDGRRAGDRQNLAGAAGVATAPPAGKAAARGFR
jgi:hypothetical protein